MDERISPDRLYSVAELCELEDACPATAYKRLALKEYGEVYKDGTRTKILGANILERRRKHLKLAQFKSPKLQGNRFHLIRRKAAEAGP
jgi:hypothetical protein